MNKMSMSKIKSFGISDAPQKSMRVLMSIDDQKRFVRAVKKKCNLKWEDFGKLCGVKGKTAKVNYCFKGRTLPLDGASQLSLISGIPLPPHKILPANWGQIQGGKASRNLSFENPPYSKELAELLGILMGDGCIFKSYNKRRKRNEHFILVTGHSRELSYYQTTVRPLFMKIFGIRGYIYKRHGQNTIVFVTRSMRIYEFLKLAGMPEGTKNKSEAFVIPAWVSANINFVKACVRGLTDTDGTVFKSHGRWINIQYKFASKSLVQSLRDELMRMGYHPTKIETLKKFNQENGKTNICWQFYLSRRNEIRNFAREIGFSNTLLKNKYEEAINL